MLKGIRIVEIEGLGPTPFAGMMFADLGAEVTVIHRKDKSIFSNSKNILDRGKRSIELDLKDPKDLEVAKKIIFRSDALIEGFRPGVMENFGLGPDDLNENPLLVYGRMTGWGQKGPKSKQSGHDLNYIGLSGALWVCLSSRYPSIYSSCFGRRCWRRCALPCNWSAFSNIKRQSIGTWLSR